MDGFSDEVIASILLAAYAATQAQTVAWLGVAVMLLIQAEAADQPNQGPMRRERPRQSHSVYPPFDLDALRDDECVRLFRFSKEDIRTLVVELEIPPVLRTVTRGVSTNIEAFCILLWRLAHPNKWEYALPLFGGKSVSHYSQIIHMLLPYLSDRWGHLLRWPAYYRTAENLRFFADQVQAKGCPLPFCVGFVDATMRALARPSLWQQVFYSGHKKIHCMKYLDIITADGMIIFQWGPAEGRHSDQWMYNESGLHDFIRTFLRFFITTPDDEAAHTAAEPWGATGIYVGGSDPAEVRPEPFVQYGIFGDKGFTGDEFACLMTGFKRAGGVPLTPAQEEFNRTMATYRIAVEWGFLAVIQSFGYVDMKKQMKLFGSPVALYYTVSTLLTNCNNCLHPNQTAQYYATFPPTLHDYLHM